MALAGEREGACAVVAEGCEAGATLGFYYRDADSQVAEALSVPALAAGECGRPNAAAFAPGAQGSSAAPVFGPRNAPSR